MRRFWNKVFTIVVRVLTALIVGFLLELAVFSIPLVYDVVNTLLVVFNVNTQVISLALLVLFGSIAYVPTTFNLKLG